MHNQTMETVLWTSDIRFVPALVLVAVGCWLFLAGVWRQARSLRLPMETRGKNHSWLRAMRQMIQGMSVLAIGLGWALQLFGSHCRRRHLRVRRDDRDQHRNVGAQAGGRRPRRFCLMSVSVRPAKSLDRKVIVRLKSHPEAGRDVAEQSFE